MILILSHSLDYSTYKVIKSLKDFNVKCLRLDVDKFFFNSNINISVSNNDCSFELEYLGERVLFDEIRVVWNRKWDIPSVFKRKVKDVVSFQIYDNLTKEAEVINSYFQKKLESKLWINHPFNASISKFEQLETAIEVGFRIPKTCISNLSNTILGKLQGDIITKPMSECLNFTENGKHYVTYTQKCIIGKDERFFPSLFQEQIKRAYELRVFVFYRSIYPMMIFTEETDNIDIRYKNYVKTNTYSSCKLSESITRSILLFMEKSKLQTGSFDLIVDKKGDTYFLEVNPFGQFDFVAKNCNYNIEERIAEYLYEEYTKTI
ncbi:MAG: hypothetical protein M0P32_06835 [Bacteroidales bacterium]|nr:hypothetical protein [Bacteroidales bacterium]MDD2636868.1 hypothetical protein [Bacteroidales bacterium]MDY0144016.1 hypothetical protein [Bacteroidales bacterium]